MGKIFSGKLPEVTESCGIKLQNNFNKQFLNSPEVLEFPHSPIKVLLNFSLFSNVNTYLFDIKSIRNRLDNTSLKLIDSNISGNDNYSLVPKLRKKTRKV